MHGQQHIKINPYFEYGSALTDLLVHTGIIPL